jgi:hypothetical protein
MPRITYSPSWPKSKQGSPTDASIVAVARHGEPVRYLGWLRVLERQSATKVAVTSRVGNFSGKTMKRSDAAWFNVRKAIEPNGPLRFPSSTSTACPSQTRRVH